MIGASRIITLIRRAGGPIALGILLQAAPGPLHAGAASPAPAPPAPPAGRGPRVSKIVQDAKAQEAPAPARQTAPPPAAGAAPVIMASLSCTGPARYQTRTNPAWITQANGTVPVALPVLLQTGQTPGRLTLNKIGMIEAAPGSELGLSAAPGGRIRLSLVRGAAFYSLRQGTRFEIAVPSLPDVTARVEGQPAGKPEVRWAPSQEVAVVGGAVVESPEVLQFLNMNGDATVHQDGSLVRKVGIGRGLQVKYLPAQGSEEAMTQRKLAVMSADAVRGNYIYKDQEMPNNWNIVTPPAISRPDYPKWHALGVIPTEEDDHDHDHGHDHHHHHGDDVSALKP